MRHLTAPMVADAINFLGSPFDCHMVERRVLRDHAVEIAQEIVAQASSGDALRYFSAVFSKCVTRTFAGQIRQTTEVLAENLGGKLSKNRQWEKLFPAVTAPAVATTLDELMAGLEEGDLEE
jgi:hypothetical protein